MRTDTFHDATISMRTKWVLTQWTEDNQNVTTVGKQKKTWFVCFSILEFFVHGSLAQVISWLKTSMEWWVHKKVNYPDWLTPKCVNQLWMVEFVTKLLLSGVVSRFQVAEMFSEKISLSVLHAIASTQSIFSAHGKTPQWKIGACTENFQKQGLVFAGPF